MGGTVNHEANGHRRHHIYCLECRHFWQSCTFGVANQEEQAYCGIRILIFTYLRQKNKQMLESFYFGSSHMCSTHVKIWKCFSFVYGMCQGHGAYDLFLFCFQWWENDGLHLHRAFFLLWTTQSTHIHTVLLHLALNLSVMHPIYTAIRRNLGFRVLPKDNVESVIDIKEATPQWGKKRMYEHM